MTFISFWIENLSENPYNASLLYEAGLFSTLVTLYLEGSYEKGVIKLISSSSHDNMRDEMTLEIKTIQEVLKVFVNNVDISRIYIEQAFRFFQSKSTEIYSNTVVDNQLKHDVLMNLSSEVLDLLSTFYGVNIYEPVFPSTYFFFNGKSGIEVSEQEVASHKLKASIFFVTWFYYDKQNFEPSQIPELISLSLSKKGSQVAVIIKTNTLIFKCGNDMIPLEFKLEYNSWNFFALIIKPKHLFSKTDITFIFNDSSKDYSIGFDTDLEIRSISMFKYMICRSTSVLMGNTSNNTINKQSVFEFKQQYRYGIFNEKLVYLLLKNTNQNYLLNSNKCALTELLKGKISENNEKIAAVFDSLILFYTPCRVHQIKNSHNLESLKGFSYVDGGLINSTIPNQISQGLDANFVCEQGSLAVHYRKIYNQIFYLGGMTNILPLFEYFYDLGILSQEDEVLHKFLTIVYHILNERKDNITLAMTSCFFQTCSLFFEKIDVRLFTNTVKNDLTGIGKLLFTYVDFSPLFFVFCNCILLNEKILCKFPISCQKEIWKMIDLFTVSDFSQLGNIISFQKIVYFLKYYDSSFSTDYCCETHFKWFIQHCKEDECQNLRASTEEKQVFKAKCSIRTVEELLSFTKIKFCNSDIEAGDETQQLLELLCLNISPCLQSFIIKLFTFYFESTRINERYKFMLIKKLNEHQFIDIIIHCFSNTLMDIKCDIIRFLKEIFPYKDHFNQNYLLENKVMPVINSYLTLNNLLTQDISDAQLSGRVRSKCLTKGANKGAKISGSSDTEMIGVSKFSEDSNLPSSFKKSIETISEACSLDPPINSGSPIVGVRKITKLKEIKYLNLSKRRPSNIKIDIESINRSFKDNVSYDSGYNYHGSHDINGSIDQRIEELSSHIMEVMRGESAACIETNESFTIKKVKEISKSVRGLTKISFNKFEMISDKIEEEDLEASPIKKGAFDATKSHKKRSSSVKGRYENTFEDEAELINDLQVETKEDCEAFIVTNRKKVFKSFDSTETMMKVIEPIEFDRRVNSYKSCSQLRTNLLSEFSKSYVPQSPSKLIVKALSRIEEESSELCNIDEDCRGNSLYSGRKKGRFKTLNYGSKQIILGEFDSQPSIAPDNAEANSILNSTLEPKKEVEARLPTPNLFISLPQPYSESLYYENVKCTKRLITVINPELIASTTDTLYSYLIEWLLNKKDKSRSNKANIFLDDVDNFLNPEIISTLLFLVNNVSSKEFYTQRLLQDLHLLCVNNLDNSIKILQNDIFFPWLLETCYAYYTDSKTQKDKIALFEFSKRFMIEIIFYGISSHSDSSVLRWISFLISWATFKKKNLGDDIAEIRRMNDFIRATLVVIFKRINDKFTSFKYFNCSNKVLIKIILFSNYLYEFYSFYNFEESLKSEFIPYIEIQSSMGSSISVPPIIYNGLTMNGVSSSDKENFSRVVSSLWKDYVTFEQIFICFSKEWLNNEHMYTEQTNPYQKVEYLIQVFFETKTSRNLFYDTLKVLTTSSEDLYEFLMTGKMSVSSAKRKEPSLLTIINNTTVIIISLMQDEEEHLFWIDQHERLITFLVLGSMNLNVKTAEDILIQEHLLEIILFSVGFYINEYINLSQSSKNSESIKAKVSALIRNIFSIIILAYDKLVKALESKNNNFLSFLNKKDNDLKQLMIYKFCADYLVDSNSHSRQTLITLQFIEECKHYQFTNFPEVLIRRSGQSNSRYIQFENELIKDKVKYIFNFKAYLTKCNQRQSEASSYIPTHTRLSYEFLPKQVKMITNILSSVVEKKAKKFLDKYKQFVHSNYMMYKGKIQIYKSLKEKAFTWRGMFADRALFPATQDSSYSRRLKFKVMHHYTSFFTQPILKLIADPESFIPFYSNFSRTNMFMSPEELKNAKACDLQIERKMLGRYSSLSLDEKDKSFYDESKLNFLSDLYKFTSYKLNSFYYELQYYLSKTFDNENYFITSSSAGKMMSHLDIANIPKSDSKTPKSNPGALNYSSKKKEKPSKQPLTAQIEFMCCLIKLQTHIKGKLAVQNGTVYFELLLLSSPSLSSPSKSRSNSKRNSTRKSDVQFYNVTRFSCNNPESDNCFGSIFRARYDEYSYIEEKFSYSWEISDIQYLFRKVYYQRSSAIMIFTRNKQSYLINFVNPEERELFIQQILNSSGNYRELKSDMKEYKEKVESVFGYEIIDTNSQSEYNGDTISHLSIIVDKWINWKISNLEFLMILNLLGDRSYLDISQYPVFPWVLENYSQSIFDSFNGVTPHSNADIIKTFKTFQKRQKKSANQDSISTTLSKMSTLTTNPRANKPNDFQLNISTKQSDTSLSISFFNSDLDVFFSSIRNFALPMGMMEVDDENKGKDRKMLYLETYNNILSDYKEEQQANTQSGKKDAKCENEPYFYGTHYSSPIYVTHYLTRLFPFSSLMIELQGNKFDDPNRLFFNLQNSFRSASTQRGDVREIIPQFFYLPELFLNNNNFNFGKKTDEEGLIFTQVDNVCLPTDYNPKLSMDENCSSDSYFNPNSMKVGHFTSDFNTQIPAFKFVICHRRILESEEVSSSLNKWIDLIFGSKQRGKEAETACNLFIPSSYTRTIDYSKFDNEMLNFKMRMVEFGVTPKQLIYPKQLATKSLKDYVRKGKQLTESTDLKAFDECSFRKNKSVLQAQLKIDVGEIWKQITKDKILKIKVVDSDKVICLYNNCTFSLSKFINSEKSFTVQPKTKIYNSQDNMKFNSKISGFNYISKAYLNQIEKNINYREFNSAKSFVEGFRVNMSFQCSNKSTIIYGAPQFHYVAHGGYWDGRIVVNDLSLNKTFNLFTGFYPITTLVMDKKETHALAGNSAGALLVFCVDKINWTEKTRLLDHSSEISSIFVCNSLNVVITSSFRGEINLYTFPKLKLFRAINYANLIISSVLLTINPLPGFAFEAFDLDKVHNQINSYNTESSPKELNRRHTIGTINYGKVMESIIKEKIQIQSTIYSYSINGQFITSKCSESVFLVDLSVIKDISFNDFIVS